MLAPCGIPRRCEWCRRRRLRLLLQPRDDTDGLTHRLPSSPLGSLRTSMRRNGVALGRLERPPMKIFRLSLALLTTAAFSCLLGSAAPAASENGAVMAVFNNAIEAFNRGDMKGWIATCSPGAAIIDEIPPHSWQGASACADWWRSFQSFSKANRVTEPSVSVETPLH